MAIICQFCGNPVKYLTVNQVADLLGKSTKTIRTWVKQGRFPGTTKAIGLTSPMAYRIPVETVYPLVEHGRTR